MIPPIINLSEVKSRFPQAKFCDVRYELGRSDGLQQYLSGHIPGAVYVSMDQVLADQPGPGVGRHPLPSPEAFARNLGQLGIADDANVIVYDAVGGRFAGRLVWMLRILGQSASLLNGGLQAWTDAGLELESGESKVQPVVRKVRPWPTDELATADEVAAHIEAGGKVFDSRAPERYRGEVEPLDPKAGHVPGAANLPFGANYADGGNYLNATETLAQRFKAHGVDENTIVYCGSGVTACNNALAIEATGVKRPRIYVGSWSGWSSEDRPVATGDES